MSTTASTTAEVDGAGSPGGAPARTKRAGRRSIASLVLRLHFYAGVLVAPFLVVAAVSGLLFVFSPQLDQLVYADELRVDRVAGQARPLAEQVTAARAAHPSGDLATVIPPVEATDTTRVVFSLPELGEKQHTVYVDPYTNEVTGTLLTWYGETPLMTWLDDLHRNLHLGDAGRHYSELAASWLWVVVLGGLVLWVRRQWTGKGRLRRLVWPDLAAGKGVRRTRGWHAALGVWLAVGLLALSATGLTWSRYAGAKFDLLQEGFDAHSPQLDTALSGGGAPAGGHHGGAPAGGAGEYVVSDVDAVVVVARRAGLTGFVEVTPPAEPGTAWVVAQDDGTWPVGFDRAAIDPASGTIVARSDFADWPVLAQLSKVGVRFHMGYLFGIVNQILLAALAIGLLCVIVWGYRMWWQRRPTRVDRAAPLGTPPARGAWRHVHPAVLVVGVVVVAFVGWAMPLLGVTLAAFLVLDLIVGLTRRRRARTAAPTSPAPTAP